MNDNLHVRVCGPDDAPPVVLLHPIATDGRIWAAQTAVWAARFRVIAIDLPGHGASPPLTAGGDLGDYAEAVWRTLDAAGVGRAALVGLSLGSMVAQRMAAQRGGAVDALVLANGVAFAPPPVAALWRQRIDDARRDGMAGQVAGTLERWFTPAFRAAAPLTVAQVGTLIRDTPVEGYAAAAGAIAVLDHRDLLGAIACPALVAAGEQDAAAPPAAVKTVADAIRGARFVCLPAAHLTNVELPVAFTELVGAFLAESAAGAGGARG